MENKELKQTIINLRTGIEYNYDYYIPNIVMSKPRRIGNVWKYGRIRARYFRERIDLSVKKRIYMINILEQE